MPAPGREDERRWAAPSGGERGGEADGQREADDDDEDTGPFHRSTPFSLFLKSHRIYAATLRPSYATLNRRSGSTLPAMSGEPPYSTAVVSVVRLPPGSVENDRVAV